MSGICGLYTLDGSAVSGRDVRAMSSILEYRGPNGSNEWHGGPVGLGHALLDTTPDAANGSQPIRDAQSGCVVTADVRLDNRHSLWSRLRPGKDFEDTADAELILGAYLLWGEECPSHLLGDFAFVIWDPRDKRLFCARDHSGIRLLYYHHTPGKLFAVASSPRAILISPDVPYTLDQGRIADYLVRELEWIDYTSTFFEGVRRLQPGHSLTVSPDTLAVREYWRPVPMHRTLSDAEFRDGFLDVLTSAVQSRMRARPGAVGSTLSGGVDSGAIAAIANSIAQSRGDGPFPTWSIANTRDSDCIESNAAYATAAMTGADSQFIHPEDGMDSYHHYISGLDEPFDGEFLFLRAIYRLARENGKRVVLDGAGGDVVLAEGSYVARLLRRGRLLKAFHEANAEQLFWESNNLPDRMMVYLRGAFVPELVIRPFRRRRYQRSATRAIGESMLSTELAEAVGMPARYETSRRTNYVDPRNGYFAERCDRIRPSVTAGRERYARLAALAGVEATDPYLDKRVIEFCSSLPGHLRLRDGWPKWILRDVMKGRLPEQVRWLTGKRHIGWQFDDAITRAAVDSGALNPGDLDRALDAFVDPSALARAWRTFADRSDPFPLHSAHVLSVWLAENQTRPVVKR